MSRKSRMPAPPQDRHPHNLTNATSVATHRAGNGYQPGDADDQREAELLAELTERGYTVAVKCLACGHPLTHPKSVAQFIGPKCASKAVGR